MAEWKSRRAITSEEPTEPQEPGFKSTDEILAEEERAAQSTEGVLGTIGAAAEGMLGAIPGAKPAQAALLSMAGIPAEFTAKKQKQLKEEHEVASLAGDVGGFIALGSVLGQGMKGLSAVQRIGYGALQSALLSPAFQLDAIASEAQMKAQRLTVEQIASAFSGTEMLEAGALAGVLGAGIEAVPGVGRLAVKGIKAGAKRAVQGAFVGTGASMGAGVAGVPGAALGALVGQEAYQQAGKLAKRVQGWAQKGKTPKGPIEPPIIEPSFSPEEIAAIQQYKQSPGFFDGLNRKLRGLGVGPGGYSYSKEIAERLPLLDSAVEKTALPQATTVYRGIEIQPSHPHTRKFADELMNMEFGDIIVDKGFLSTTPDELVAEHLSGLPAYRKARSFREGEDVGSIVMRINVPKGYPALDMQALGKKVQLLEEGASENLKKETELLLPRGTKLQLKGYQKGTKYAGQGGGAGGEDRSHSILEFDVIPREVDAMLAPPPPAAKAVEKRFERALNSLFGGVVAGAADAVTPDADFDKVSKALQEQLADPEGTGQRIRVNFDSLEPEVADALTANIMNKLQAAAMDLPPDQGPATAFGFQTGHSDRQKREFLRKFKAKFDPFYAVESGRADLVKEAEIYNPEIINLIRNRAVERLSEDPNLPYMTKRRISAILGVAGTPTQDPALASQLQQQIQLKRKANSQVGQMGSARQMKANMKNDSATLTRAQKILNSGE